MGGLTKLKFPEETISTPGGDFSVRGLSSVSIAMLTLKNRETLRSLFSQAMDAEGNLQLDNMESVALLIGEKAPSLLAEVIAVAAGEYTDDGIEAARSIPFPAQVEALEVIGRLTFAMEGGLKKLMATVINVTKGTTKALSEAQTSMSGIEG